MEEATSFLFPDGVSVKAELCNYLSYKELCLICPTCHQSVILASLHSNKQVAHFRHRRAGIEELPDCPERVKLLPPKEVNRLKVLQRNQRVKLLNKYLWNVVKGSLSKTNIEGLIEETLELWRGTNLPAIVGGSFQKAYKGGQVGHLIYKFRAYLIAEGKNTPGITGFLESLNMEAHVKSVEGVCDFLSIKSSYPLLEKLVCYALWDYTRYSEKDSANFPPLETGFVPIEWAIADVVAMMLVIPWQEAMLAAQRGEAIPQGIIMRPRLATALVDLREI